ncbi:MAG: cytochrome C [Pseudomonadota bacterium]
MKSVWLCSLLIISNACMAMDASSGISPGKALIAACSGCHHASNALHLPSLINLSSDVMREKLMAYKYDQITGTLMNRIAKGYTDEEIALIALTYSMQHATSLQNNSSNLNR